MIVDDAVFLNYRLIIPLNRTIDWNQNISGESAGNYSCEVF